MSENKNDVSVNEVCAGQDTLGWGCLGISVYVKILVVGVLFCYLFSDEINKVVSRWVSDPSWSHGFLIPFFSLYLFNQNKADVIRLKPAPSYMGLLFLLCCIVFYPLNIVYFKVGYFQPLVVIAALGSIILFLGGWR